MYFFLFSLSKQVTNQVLKLSDTQDHWEVLPYQLAQARKFPSAIAMNVEPVLVTSEQECANDFAIVTSSPLTPYKTLPTGSPHIFMILEDQRVFDFDASKETLEQVLPRREPWPASIINSVGVFFANHFVTSGGSNTVSYLQKVELGRMKFNTFCFKIAEKLFCQR